MKRLQRAAYAAIALVALIAQPGSAQVVIGNGGGPEVQVNLGVLDHLPASGPVVDGKRPTHLKRPGAVANSAAPKAAAKHKTAAKTQRAATPPAAAHQTATHQTGTHQAAKPTVATADDAKPTKTASIADTTVSPPKIETKPLAPVSAPTDARVDAETTPPLPPPEPAASAEQATQPSAAQTTEAPPPAPAKPAAAAKQITSAPESTADAPTTSPAPAASAAPAIVAGGLLAGAGEASVPSRATNVPSRNAPAPAATRDRQQTAALAAPPATAGANGFRISFTGSSGDLSPAAQTQLASLAQLLAGNNDRIILNGYASGDAASGARRVALTRVLAVRAYLVDKGVPQTRIDVRAVGTPTDSSSPERVDIAKLGH